MTVKRKQGRKRKQVHTHRNNTVEGVGGVNTDIWQRGKANSAVPPLQPLTVNAVNYNLSPACRNNVCHRVSGHRFVYVRLGAASDASGSRGSGTGTAGSGDVSTIICRFRLSPVTLRRDGKTQRCFGKRKKKRRRHQKGKRAICWQRDGCKASLLHRPERKEKVSP